MFLTHVWFFAGISRSLSGVLCKCSGLNGKTEGNRHTLSLTNAFKTFFIFVFYYKCYTFWVCCCTPSHLWAFHSLQYLYTQTEHLVTHNNVSKNPDNTLEHKTIAFLVSLSWQQRLLCPRQSEWVGKCVYFCSTWNKKTTKITQMTHYGWAAFVRERVSRALRSQTQK